MRPSGAERGADARDRAPRARPGPARARRRRLSGRGRQRGLEHPAVAERQPGLADQPARGGRHGQHPRPRTAADARPEAAIPERPVRAELPDRRQPRRLRRRPRRVEHPDLGRERRRGDDADGRPPPPAQQHGDRLLVHQRRVAWPARRGACPWCRCARRSGRCRRGPGCRRPGRSARSGRWSSGASGRASASRRRGGCRPRPAGGRSGGRRPARSDHWNRSTYGLRNARLMVDDTGALVVLREASRIYPPTAASPAPPALPAIKALRPGQALTRGQKLLSSNGTYALSRDRRPSGQSPRPPGRQQHPPHRRQAQPRRAPAVQQRPLRADLSERRQPGHLRGRQPGVAHQHPQPDRGRRVDAGRRQVHPVQPGHLLEH